MPAPRPMNWTAEMDTLLCSLYATGTSRAGMEKVLGLCDKTIGSRMDVLGLPRMKRQRRHSRPATEPVTTRRKCLSCSAGFDALDHNRVCNECKKTDAWRGATL